MLGKNNVKETNVLKECNDEILPGLTSLVILFFNFNRRLGMEEKHGCFNKPIGKPYIVQDGWDIKEEKSVIFNTNKIIKTPIWKSIDFVLTKTCVYSREHTQDPKCEGCNKKT